MKLYPYLLLIFFIVVSIKGQIYVDPVNGSDINSGTIDFPLLTITRAMDAATVGTTIYLRGGVYNYNSTIKTPKSGTAESLISIIAFENEHPIIDFVQQPISTSSRGFYINKNYWHFKGLEIRSSKDNGIYITGSFNKVENCKIHDCCDTGLQISGGGSNNIIINCDSYKNYDSLTLGENADGFAPKLDIGPGNEFYNCRAWENSDDGWDMYESDDPVKIVNCQAFRNGFNVWGIANFAGDGNGFKLGGNYIAGSHIITNSIAFDNKSKGFDQNNNTAGVIVYNNTAFRNMGKNFSFPTNPDSTKHILKNNISFNGSVSLADSTEQEKNSWQGFNVFENDFISIDTTGVTEARNLDGTLKESNFLHLQLNSSMIDAGVSVGLPYNGTAPDLGAYETIGTGFSNENNQLIGGFQLNQNYPNPFNPNTNISFNLQSSSFVTLTIYDILGNRLEQPIDGYLSEGNYNFNWVAKNEDGSYLSTGIYFAKLNCGNMQQVIKMMLVK